MATLIFKAKSNKRLILRHPTCKCPINKGSFDLNPESDKKIVDNNKYLKLGYNC